MSGDQAFLPDPVLAWRSRAVFKMRFFKPSLAVRHWPISSIVRKQPVQTLPFVSSWQMPTHGDDTDIFDDA
ncbi:hypothetical protein THS27_16470 [Thalassospira sp. MCCC 1A01428]|nr:hypothetical protein THS27_16470 [Thalassospira sp. MCCC 1A01428]